MYTHTHTYTYIYTHTCIYIEVSGQENTTFVLEIILYSSTFNRSVMNENICLSEDHKIG